PPESAAILSRQAGAESYDTLSFLCSSGLDKMLSRNDRAQHRRLVFTGNAHTNSHAGPCSEKEPPGGKGQPVGNSRGAPVTTVDFEHRGAAIREYLRHVEECSIVSGDKDLFQVVVVFDCYLAL